MTRATRTGGTWDMFDEESLAMLRGESEEADTDQRAQWDREAEAVRAAVLGSPSVLADTQAVAFLTAMLTAEDRGLARWDKVRSDWYPIRNPKGRTTTSDHPGNRRAMTRTDLTRFHKLRSTGPDRWTALCPAHDDHTPSLAIRFTGERWLFHCHARECAFRDIVRCAGLTDVDMQVSR